MKKKLTLFLLLVLIVQMLTIPAYAEKSLSFATSQITQLSVAETTNSIDRMNAIVGAQLGGKDYVYVAGKAGLEVYDITNPASPVLVQFTTAIKTLEYMGECFFIKDGYLVIGEANAIKAYPINQATGIVTTDTGVLSVASDNGVPAGVLVDDLFIVGNYNAAGGRIEVFDVSDVTNIRKILRSSESIGARQLAVEKIREGYYQIYYRKRVNPTASVYTYAISTLTVENGTATLRDVYDGAPSFNGAALAVASISDIEVIGTNKLAVSISAGSGANIIAIMDTSNPASPVVTQTLIPQEDKPNWAYQDAKKIDDTHFAAVTNSGRIFVYNYNGSVWAQERLVANHTSTAYDVELFDGKMLVAVSSKFVIFDAYDAISIDTDEVYIGVSSTINGTVDGAIAGDTVALTINGQKVENLAITDGDYSYTYIPQGSTVSVKAELIRSGSAIVSVAKTLGTKLPITVVEDLKVTDSSGEEASDVSSGYLTATIKVNNAGEATIPITMYMGMFDYLTDRLEYVQVKDFNVGAGQSSLTDTINMEDLSDYSPYTKYLKVFVWDQNMQPISSPKTVNKAETLGGSVWNIYIPENTEKVKGLVLINHHGNGLTLSEMPAFQSFCADRDLAILSFFDDDQVLKFFADGEACSQLIFDKIDEFATKTGHPELRDVPYATFGHSNAGAFAVRFARQNPEKTFACIAYKISRGVYMDYDEFATNNVPTFVMTGETDALWGFMGQYAASEDLVAQGALMNYIQDPGVGHSWSNYKSNTIMFEFLDKALEHKLNEDGSLKTIDKADGFVGYGTYTAGDMVTNADGDEVQSYKYTPVGYMTYEEYLAKKAEDPSFKIQAWLFDEEYAADWVEYGKNGIIDVEYPYH